MFKEYMQLARLPNAFTASSNVVAGYFTITPVSELNYLSLATLMVSSALLYMSGVIFNDYFDIETDVKERPFRPLPSGSISKHRAIQTAFIFMTVAIMLAFSVGWSSFTIAIFISCIIFAYDYKLKHNKFLSPMAMGSARFLNVILGATPVLHMPLHSNFLQPIFAATSVFVYVAVITVFSRKEISGIQSKRQTVILFSIVYVVISLITFATFLGLFNISAIAILVMFAVIICIIFRKILSGSAAAIQDGIKNLVLSIILLDSIFVGGTAGLLYAVLNISLLIPPLLLSRRLYIT